MAEAHVEEHQSLIKTPQQLIVVVVLAFLVPVLAIVMIAELATGGLKVDHNSPAMSDAAVAERLKPISATPPAPSGPAAPGAAKTAANPGEALYQSVCTACHGAGIAGAPKTGDKAAWKPRIAQGIDTLYEHAIKGKGAMPPKGGAMGSPDADVKAAVDYLVGQSK
ncbi:MAG TPA: c-type cytochrome [Burkholderiales bacterium]|nr:c-type cytochrome [Burkholderiales bacterium]